MASLTATDPFLRFATWAETSILAAVLACVLAIIIMRATTIRRQRRIARQEPHWRKALAAAMFGEMPALRVARRDRWYFIKLWCQFHDAVRGDAREILLACARVLGMHKWALELASRRRLRDRLLGIIAVGCMGEFAAIAQLRALIDDPNTVLSLTAAEAYARLVPTDALPIVLHAAARREDWPLARLMEIIWEAGPNASKEPLLAAIATNRGKHRIRLIPLLECLESKDTVATVRELLAAWKDPETLATALPLARPDDMPLVRAAAAHPAWFVRAKACRILGEFGDTTDTKLLEDLLGDPEWWVRYRAAESMLKIPGIDCARLRTLAIAHPDRFARHMLTMWLDQQGIAA